MPQERDELAELFPGKTIEIKGNGRTVRVTVYPMAIRGGAMRDMLLSKTEST